MLITWKIYIDYISKNEDCKIIINHIKPHNTIITDGWQSYNFLNRLDSNCPYEVHIHGPQGNFAFGSHSTSYIGGVWGTVKQYIKIIYNLIPDNNFILFLGQGEFRYNLRGLDNSEKEKKKFKYFNTYIFLLIISIWWRINR